MRRARPLIVLSLLAVLLAGLLPAAAAQDPEPDFRALVFSKTAGFRHDSIPAGIAAIQQLGADNGFDVDATEDAGQFTDAGLAPYDVVIWLSTTGDVLNADQQAAFERYVQAGGGYAGVHAAADTEYDWAWYGELVGAYFASHPAIQTATVEVEDAAHPATAHLPASWERTDEWYNYQSNPRGDVHVLATLDEGSYDAGSGAMGDDHPIAWCHGYDGGRSWYTGGGHTQESYNEPDFLQHLLGGIQSAAGAVAADCSVPPPDPDGPPDPDDFEKVTLTSEVGEPMGLAVLPDGRVLHTARTGEVRLFNPGTGQDTIAATIPVYLHDEDGLQALAIDPAFEENGWVYIYYSPPLDTPPGDGQFPGENWLSRFTLVGDSLDLESEVTLLKVGVTRGLCCHVGGDVAFDAAGNLFLATGDDTNPFESGGYAPLDEREGREGYDAQRSSGNTDDLRGKLLRITPQPDGTYTVPEGNLFPPGTEGTRPEIYSMGHRNLFRFSVDSETGWVYAGEVGPDAGSPSATRGPEGYDELNQIRGPGNFGWPYCIGPNTPYVDYTFPSGPSGEPFDCAGGPTNDSPNNTGLAELPPAQPAFLWYPYGPSEEFPELDAEGGRTAMGGPVYHYDPELESDTKFPEYYDDKVFFYEWSRDYIKALTLGEDGSLEDIEDFLPDEVFDNPMDMEFGPDGSLYLLEYGDGYFSQNPEAQLSRVDYVAGGRSPVVTVAATPTSGQPPLTVSFTATATDPDGDTPLTYAWDLDGDGTVDATDPNPTFTYTSPGAYFASVTVTDATGSDAVAGVTVTVGNTAPTVTIAGPPDGGFFDFGDEIAWAVDVTDPEDGTVDCADVVVQSALGHDNHAHPISQATGCAGTFDTSTDEGHPEDADLFWVIGARYTDQGAGDVPALTGEDQVRLQPKRLQAENFAEASGIQLEPTTDPEGGQEAVAFIDAGDLVAYDPVNLQGITSATFRVASAGAGGAIELRLDEPGGELIGTVDVPVTGSWQSWVDVDVPLTDPGGTHRLYLVFTNQDPAATALFNLNYIEFNGKGVATNAAPEVTATATPTSGEVPLTVAFDGAATDVEGEALTYAWDFGVDGATAATEDASYTYASPGTYTATLTVTDAAGNAGSDSVQVVVTAPPAEEPDDEFEGDALDLTRWNSVVRPDPAGYRVTGGALEIDTTPTDIYGTANTGTPNLVLQPAPAGDWTIATKVDVALTEQYQQAGLIVYSDDDNYVKLDPVADNPPGAAQNVRVELRAEVGGVLQQPQPQVVLGDVAGDTYWLRLTRTGDSYTGSFSLDGTTWTDVGAAVSPGALANPRMGLFALGASQTTATTAAFDWFRVLGDDPEPEPAITIGGVVQGTLYGDSQDRRITFSAGTGTATATLDGEPILSGTLQAMYELDLGEHVLEVSAGGAVERVSFYVTTSTRDMNRLINRFEATGRLFETDADALRATLREARLAEADDEDAAAIAALEAFSGQVEELALDDAEVADVLVRDAGAMIVRFGGSPPAAGVAANGGRSLAGVGRVAEDPDRASSARDLVAGRTP
jgi:PKD repeat protein/type 1 glutamine amidotransferase